MQSVTGGWIHLVLWTQPQEGPGVCLVLSVCLLLPGGCLPTYMDLGAQDGRHQVLPSCNDTPFINLTKPNKPPRRERLCLYYQLVQEELAMTAESHNRDKVSLLLELMQVTEPSSDTGNISSSDLRVRAA